jgi:hypothetical protein
VSTSTDLVGPMTLEAIADLGIPYQKCAYADIDDGEIFEAEPCSQDELWQPWEEHKERYRRPYSRAQHAGRIRAIADLIVQGVDFPPVQIEFGRYAQIHNGNHTLRAYQFLDHPTFPCDASGYVDLAKRAFARTHEMHPEIGKMLV